MAILESVRVSQDLTVGPQPSQERLRQLAEDGYRSVVNVRYAGESDQDLTPAQEGRLVRGLEMSYLHFPVKLKGLRPEHVDHFRHELDYLPAPVYLHCDTGERVEALAVMTHAIREGRSGEDALAEAKALDFDHDNPELARFIQVYVDLH
jgi:uncharacterized protein (TIGR01244 family)